MKLIILVAILITISSTSNAQQSDVYLTSADNISLINKPDSKTISAFNADTIIKNYSYYLQKSKNKRTAGWVFLGGGVVAIGAGLAIGANKNATFDDAATGGIIAVVGALASLGSIPFFVSASSNKRKAGLL